MTIKPRVKSGGKASTGTRRKAGARSSSKPARKKTTPGTADDDQLLSLVPSGLASAFVNTRLHDKSIAVAGLGAPPDWQGDMPEVPDDIGTVDHSELANLMAQFVNALSTALWHSSKAYVESGLYQDIVDYLTNIAITESDQSNDTKRRAEANTDESVIMAKALYRTAYSDHVRFRDVARTLELRWKTVSRVGGFVGDEADGDDASAIKRSTRGKSAGASKGRSRGSTRMRSRK